MTDRTRLLVLGALGAAGAIVAVLWLLWLMAVIPGGVDQSGTPIGWDFRAFHSAATLLASGRSAAMYQWPFPDGLTGPPFVNPPFTAVFFLPFVPLGVVPAWLLWDALSIVAMAAGFRALGMPSWRTATVAALFSVPVFFALRLGQTSLMVFLLMSLSYAALRRGRLKTGGALLGLVVFKPQLLVGFVFWWLSRIRTMRPAIVGGFASGGFLVAVSLILFTDAWVSFVDIARHLPSLYAFGDSPYYEFAMWNVVISDAAMDPTAITWLSVGLTVASGAALIWFVRRVDDDLALAFSGAVAVGLIGAAHIVVHDWTLLLIPIVLLWYRLPERRPAWAAIGLALLYTTLLSPFLVAYQLDAFGTALNVAPLVLLTCTVLAGRLAVRALAVEGRPREVELAAP
jgi:alpha-1,2-mannosyltransferase